MRADKHYRPTRSTLISNRAKRKFSLPCKDILNYFTIFANR